MKIRKFQLAIFLVLFTLNLKSQTSSKLSYKNQDSDKLEITGMIPGLKDGETVYLNIWDAKKRDIVLIDSSLVKNGKIFLHYSVEDGPRLFWIKFSKHQQIIAVPFNNEKVTLASANNIDNIRNVAAFPYLIFDGSEIARQHLYLNHAVFNSWYFTRNKIAAEIRKFGNSTLSKGNLDYISGLLKAQDFLDQNTGQILISQPIQDVIPLFFNNIPVQFQRDSFFVTVYNHLDEKIKNSYYGKLMKEQIPLCVNQVAPNFQFKMQDGKMTSLEGVIKTNKLTILHFWSNKSIDRERIHTELSDVYKKYHSNKLEIVSVSLDANEDKWKRVIEEDKIPGYQTCDFKEEESPIAKLYKMSPNDTVNILIDENGKILAWDVDGPALFGYLYRVFGE